MAAQKAFKDQYDNEEMLYLFRRHPVVMRKGLILASFLILLGTVPSFIKPTLSAFYIGLGVGFLLAFLVMLYNWIGWYYSVFIVTDQRFIQISQKGMFDRAVVDIALEQIQMVNYHIKGLQETMLGFGTLNIQTLVGELNLQEIHKPAVVQKELNQILRKHIQGTDND